MASFVCPECKKKRSIHSKGTTIQCAGCGQYYLVASITGEKTVFFRKISELMAKNLMAESQDELTALKIAQQFPEIRNHWLIKGKECLKKKKNSEAIALFQKIIGGEQRNEEANNLLLTEYFLLLDYAAVKQQMSFMIQHGVEIQDIVIVLNRIIEWGESIFVKNEELLDALKIYVKNKAVPFGFREEQLRQALIPYEQLYQLLCVSARFVDSVDVATGERFHRLIEQAQTVFI